MTSATVAFGSRTRPPVTGIMSPRISRVLDSAIFLSLALAVVGDHFLGQLFWRADETHHTSLARAVYHRADHAGIRILCPDYAAFGFQILAAFNRIMRHAGKDDRSGLVTELIGHVAQHLIDRRT